MAKTLYLIMKQEENKIKSWWEKVRYKMDEEKEEEEYYLFLPKAKNKEKLIQKVEEKITLKDFDNVILSNDAKEYFGEEAWKETRNVFQKKQNRYFLLSILSYILEKQGKRWEETDLYVLANEYSKEMQEVLVSLLARFKVVHIVSQNQKYYVKWIKRMEEAEKTNLVYSRNYRKGLAHAGLIVNFDFSKEDFQKFRINQQAIIVNFPKEKIDFQQIFNGIMIYDFKIEFPEEVLAEKIRI